MRNKLSLFLIVIVQLSAQSPFMVHDDPVPKALDRLYVKGLKYLVSIQSSDGSFQGSTPGVTGLALLSFLAHGEDPNSGRWSKHVKKAVSNIISKQSSSGYLGSSMYNHGFATLALAEAYGAVDNDKLGPALDKAVKLLLKSQSNNPRNAWRYSPESSSADTTVSGACAVALLAARNAGFEIPKSSVKNILDYYKSCQSNDGGIGYTSANGSNGVRSSIGTLVYQLSRKKKRPEYKLLLNYILNSSQNTPRSHRYYYLYYTSQAQFHAGHKYWEVWNKQNIQLLLNSQNSDGSWSGSSGLAFCTSTALLSLALNYRFLPIYER